MCKAGDIILVNQYTDNNNILRKHSFVVISDENGEIEGLPYDMICNVLSSFKSESQQKRKLSYPGNFPVSNDDTVTNPDNGKSGYIKTDQLYFFSKDRLDFSVIGFVKQDIFELIIEFINDSDFDLTAITDNL